MITTEQETMIATKMEWVNWSHAKKRKANTIEEKNSPILPPALIGENLICSSVLKIKDCIAELTTE